MKDLHNHWLNKIAQKREIVQKVRKQYIPSIYKPVKVTSKP